VVAAVVLPSPVPTLAWIAGAILATPAIVDFVAELSGKIGPSPRRLITLTIPLSIGLGLLAAAATISTLL
jgi:hypothetical protein